MKILAVQYHAVCLKISITVAPRRLTDHPRSGMVYNFGHVCLFVDLSDDNVRKP